MGTKMMMKNNYIQELIFKHIFDCKEMCAFHESIIPDLNEFSKLLNACKITNFNLFNDTFHIPDAPLYYAIINKFKPKTIVEIGSGNSTIVAGFSCKHIGIETKIIAIDPCASRNKKLPESARYIEKKLEDTVDDIPGLLEPNDILFIDSSHVLEENNDVFIEYFNILPRLKPGVVVHIHDVYMPDSYEGVCRVFPDKKPWTEQYVLQTLLLANMFDVLWAGNYLEKECSVMKDFPDYLKIKERYPNSKPSSFWMVRNNAFNNE